MKILWLSDLDEGVMWNQNFFYERKEFGRQHEVFPWGPGHRHYDLGFDAHDVDSQFGPFDLVVCAEFFLYTKPLKNVRELECPKVAILCDNYRNGIGMRKRDWARDGVEIVLHRYNVWIDEFQAACPEVTFYWQPWGVDPEIYKPKHRKLYDLSILGNVSAHLYPRRARVLEKVAASGIRLLRTPHPTGFRYESDTKQAVGSSIGRDYAKLLASATLGLATGGKPDFAVGKYFTIPACGSVLLATWCDDLEALGFEPGVHMIPLDVERPVQQIEDLLADPGYLQEVVGFGKNLILGQHTWARRVTDFTDWYMQLTGDSSSGA